MYAANLLGPTMNIARGLFGQAPEIDLGRVDYQDYTDFSPMEKQFSNRQNRNLAALRAGLEGSGATGAELRAGYQAGFSGAQDDAAQFYGTLAGKRAEDKARVDGLNIDIDNTNVNRMLQEGQFMAQNDPAASLSTGIGQFGTNLARLGMDQLRLNNLGTANYGAFGNFLGNLFGQPRVV